MAARRRRRAPALGFPERAEVLRRRAQGHARKGDHRKAAQTMRQVVALDEQARSWVGLGQALRRARRIDEAIRAFQQGIYLHRRAGHVKRAQTVARLIEAIV